MATPMRYVQMQILRERGRVAEFARWMSDTADVGVERFYMVR